MSEEWKEVKLKSGRKVKVRCSEPTLSEAETCIGLLGSVSQDADDPRVAIRLCRGLAGVAVDGIAEDELGGLGVSEAAEIFRLALGWFGEHQRGIMEAIGRPPRGGVD